MKVPSRVFVALIAVVMSMAAAAQTFQGVGIAPGGSLSTPNNMSDDGTTVVGNIAFPYQGFRWTQGGGIAGLGYLPSSSGVTEALGVNGDGSVVVGYDGYGGGNGRPWRWTAATGLVQLSTPNGFIISVAYGVSADGSAVVGFGILGGIQQAYRWTEGTGMIGFGTLPGDAVSQAYGVSRDGAFAVGASYAPDGTRRSVRWGASALDLGHLPGGNDSYAISANHDGSVIAGQSNDASGRYQSYRWTPAGVSGLGFLPGANDSVTYRLSGDGNVVVGASGGMAFRWTAVDGMKRVSDLLAAQGVSTAGWQLTVATGVSTDGTIISGRGIDPNGRDQGWIATLPLPSPVADAPDVFISDYGTASIWRVKPDGTKTQILAGLANVRGIAIDSAAERIYFHENVPHRISVADYDGGNRAALLTSTASSYDLKLDLVNGKVYWSGSIGPGVGAIFRANLDGSGQEVIPVPTSTLNGIAPDPANGKIYWVNRGTAFFGTDGTIARANLDGSAHEILVTGLFDPNTIALDVNEGYMYWTQGYQGLGRIMRAGLDGSSPTALITGLDSPSGFTLDLAARKMYWTHEGQGSAGRANLDGSQVETFVTGLSRPVSIAVASDQPAPEEQAIDFPAPASSAAFGSTFPVSATASSALPVSIVASGVCTIAGGMVTITSGNGTCTLTASQAGDGDYAPAPDVVRSVEATQRRVTVMADSIFKFLGNADPVLSYHIVLGSLVPGDDFVGALERVAGEVAGSYGILQGSLTLGANYELGFAGNVLTIVKVVLDGPLDPIAKGSSATLIATYPDTGIAAPACNVAWGDPQLTTPVAGSVQKVGGAWICTATHEYSTVGVFSPFVTISDAYAGTTSISHQFVVVFDSSGGFVTGGGWIHSPPGAYAAVPALSGKATFGFVSRYQKGAQVPSGNTQFQFHAAGFEFRSNAYDWLVVAGAKAQYKGTGSVNGAGEYAFLLTATDGQASGGGGQDKLRIKVWDKASGTVVYDNAAGSDDINESGQTTLGAGSITVHR